MATHNPKESRPTCESTLSYMYRGDNHEHAVGQVRHLGGNILSQDPIQMNGHEVSINLAEISAEFNYQASLHRGKGEDLFKHYVVSLAPGESLKDYQWLELITAYMEELGFDNSTKWIACEHRDTDASHVHILACRVRGDKHGSLVSTYRDYEKGWPVMREFEKKFGLRQLENPEENFGLNKSKSQIKASKKGTENNFIDEAAAIRTAFKKLYSDFGKPKNMKGLVLGLAKYGVDVKVSTNDSDCIKGINYRLRNGKGSWVSGSKVKATRFSWAALQKKEGISYDPFRDDPFLRREGDVVEISVDINAMKAFYGFKSTALELTERRMLLAKFRAKESVDIETLMEWVDALMKIASFILGIPLQHDDLYFEVVRQPDEKTGLLRGGNIERHLIDWLGKRDGIDLGVLMNFDSWVNPRSVNVKAAIFEKQMAGKARNHDANLEEFAR